ncbi:DUF308 domain-containing protein [Butyrivibrio sp. VCD2006]|uniref:DUF308 domain-containing protein n=1 Tax=Butyrivibrio sp. VCD2006 TaxID=1280664 RepID=UPI0004222FDB|nr:DUF308 domain-containing protein [Butyrivibrio sp. VCD2006]
MTKFQRLRSIAFSIIMILGSIIFILDPEDGYTVVVTILGIWLLFYGIGTLFYFFTMARHMVGGKYILYKGFIFTDFGYLTASISDIPRVYVLIYLIVIHAFAGLVEILRALENHRYGAAWRAKFFHGLFDILLAALCIILIKKTHTAIIVYSIGLFYSAIMRIGSALRKDSYLAGQQIY